MAKIVKSNLNLSYILIFSCLCFTSSIQRGENMVVNSVKQHPGRARYNTEGRAGI